MRTAGCGVGVFLLCTFGSMGCAPRTDAAARQEPPRVDADQMLADVAFLAADSLEGRLSGSRGNRVARELTTPPP